MGISRRRFLRTACAAGAVGAGLGCPSKASAETDSHHWMGMLTDLSLCIGCRKCEWACNEANELPNEPLAAFEDKTVFGQQRRPDANKFTVVNRFDGADGADPVYVKRQCMHCVEPACASACLVAAFKKTKEGPVLYNEDVCIGCRYCMIACPFSMPAYEYSEPFTPRVRKCTMCHARFTRDGEIPACAKICPEEAITFGLRTELIKLAQDKIRANPKRYVDRIYGEQEAGGTNWLYVSPVPFEELGFPANVGEKPYPELTKGFLSAVPLVLVMWPMLLMGAYTFNNAKAKNEAVSLEKTIGEEKP